MPVRASLGLLGGLFLLAGIVYVPVVGVLIAGLALVGLIALGGGFPGQKRRPRGPV